MLRTKIQWVVMFLYIYAYDIPGRHSRWLTPGNYSHYLNMPINDFGISKKFQSTSFIMEQSVLFIIIIIIEEVVHEWNSFSSNISFPQFYLEPTIPQSFNNHSTYLNHRITSWPFGESELKTIKIERWNSVSRCLELWFFNRSNAWYNLISIGFFAIFFESFKN